MCFALPTWLKAHSAIYNIQYCKLPASHALPGLIAQLVERSLSMREVLDSISSWSTVLDWLSYV